MFLTFLLSNWKTIVLTLVITILSSTIAYYKHENTKLNQEIVQVKAEVIAKTMQLDSLSSSLVSLKKAQVETEAKAKANQSKLIKKYTNIINGLNSRPTVVLNPSATCDENVDAVLQQMEIYKGEN